MALTFARPSGAAVRVDGAGTDGNVPNVSAWGSTSEWAASGHILGVGEMGLDTTTGDLKAGNGSSLFSALSAVNSGTYGPILTDPSTITYNGDGTVATQTVQGVATFYTYNGDGTVATETRAGVTRTYTYDGSGNLTAVTF